MPPKPTPRHPAPSKRRTASGVFIAILCGVVAVALAAWGLSNYRDNIAAANPTTTTGQGGARKPLDATTPAAIAPSPVTPVR